MNILIVTTNSNNIRTAQNFFRDSGHNVIILKTIEDVLIGMNGDEITDESSASFTKCGSRKVITPWKFDVLLIDECPPFTSRSCSGYQWGFFILLQMIRHSDIKSAAIIRDYNDDEWRDCLFVLYPEEKIFIEGVPVIFTRKTLLSSHNIGSDWESLLSKLTKIMDKKNKGGTDEDITN